MLLLYLSFNIVAALAYPDISEAGYRDHIVWGIMLMVAMVHGSGRYSLDHLIKKHFYKSAESAA